MCHSIQEPPERLQKEAVGACIVATFDAAVTVFLLGEEVLTENLLLCATRTVLVEPL